MAASELGIQNSTFNGIDTTFNAANADGNFFENNGKTFLIFANASGGDVVVTIDSPTYCSQGFQHDLTITVNDGDNTAISFLDQNRFNDSDEYVNISYDSVTDFTVAVVNVS